MALTHCVIEIACKMGKCSKCNKNIITLFHKFYYIIEENDWGVLPQDKIHVVPVFILLIEHRTFDIGHYILHISRVGQVIPTAR